MIKTEVIILEGKGSVRSEEFLKLYRRLEGLLERRYVGRKTNHSSVVREYMDDPDSAPFRTQLDLCREIRNLLSHNADEAGEPVLEPSESMLKDLRRIVEHVQKPRKAIDFGTPRDKIMFAHPNERVTDVIHRMRKMGYSHVPVCQDRYLVGVFSASSMLAYFDKNGFTALDDDMRMHELKGALSVENERSEKYIFLPLDATVLAVRDAFQERNERNSRVAAVFLTETGDSRQEIRAMLTPWDVLRETPDDR